MRTGLAHIHDPCTETARHCTGTRMKEQGEPQTVSGAYRPTTDFGKHLLAALRQQRLHPSHAGIRLSSWRIRLMLAHPSQAGNRVGAGTHLELASGAELASAQASAMSHGAAWRTLAGRSKAPRCDVLGDSARDLLLLPAKLYDVDTNSTQGGLLARSWSRTCGSEASCGGCGQGGAVRLRARARAPPPREAGSRMSAFGFR